jgi:hypothetical protein
MWCEDGEEEGGVTASEETNADCGTAAAFARKSLGDVLGDHCLQNLIESPCSAPEPHRQRVPITTAAQHTITVIHLGVVAGAVSLPSYMLELVL